MAIATATAGTGHAGVLFWLVRRAGHAARGLRVHRAPLILALVALALRLPLLSTSIDEIDSANFVNALNNGYDIPLLRPHAPGYPVYLFAGYLVRPFVGDPVLALALISAILGSLTAIPFYLLAKEFIGGRVAVVGTALFIVNPLFWTFSETALSDVPSVFMVVMLAWLAYRGRESDRALIGAAVVVSLAIGIRQPNIAFLALLAFPVVYRAVVSRRPWKRATVVTVEVFLATTVLWMAPMILIGSGGLGDYLAAVDKQWAGAVRPYDIFHVDSPWMLSAAERAERFVIGYLFTHPWVGIDARTPLATALQIPWVLGLGFFLSGFSLRNRRHVFLLLWIAAIAYPIFTIHFLPRYGLSIIPGLVLATVAGYRFLWDDLMHHPNRTTVILLVAIGSTLLLIGVKHQPPVDPFEWTPPEGGAAGGLVFLAGGLALIAARVVVAHPGADNSSAAVTSGLIGIGRFRADPVALGLGLLVLPLALASFSLASPARDGVPPNQQLVEFVRDSYDMNRVTVCWDGQTHGYFEVLTPGVVPRGFWTIDELTDGFQAGDILLVTDRCARFDEVASLVDLQEIAEFSGTSPLWSKTPSITLFAGEPHPGLR